jgi:hypothetical protein
MEITEYKRDVEHFKKILTSGKNGIVTTSKEIDVMFPKRFEKINLAKPGIVYDVIGAFAIVDHVAKKYSVLTIPAMLRVPPSRNSTIDVNGVKYTKLTIYPNDMVFSTEVIISGMVIYDLMNEFDIQGNVPWYMNEQDVAKKLQYSDQFTGSDIGDHLLAFEIYVSITARNPLKREQPYRLLANDLKLLNIHKPEFTGLQNVFLTYDSTIDKIGGNYFKMGVSSAIVNQEKKLSGKERTFLE